MHRSPAAICVPTFRSALPVLDQAQGVVDSARPQVERGISKAQQQAQRITKRGSDSGGGTAYGGAAGMGSGSAPSPGV